MLVGQSSAQTKATIPQTRGPHGKNGKAAANNGTKPEVVAGCKTRRMRCIALKLLHLLAYRCARAFRRTSRWWSGLIAVATFISFFLFYGPFCQHPGAVPVQQTTGTRQTHDQTPNHPEHASKLIPCGRQTLVRVVPHFGLLTVYEWPATEQVHQTKNHTDQAKPQVITSSKQS